MRTSPLRRAQTLAQHGGLFRRCQGTWDKHLFLGEIHKLGAEFVDTPPSWGADYEDRLALSLEQDGV